MDLHQELIDAFRGNPWHGKSSLEIVEASDPEKVFAHWIPDAHSIAEIVLHLAVWTEEAVERLNGKSAKAPAKGDWPVVSQTDGPSWQKIVDDFKTAHQKMIACVENFRLTDWDSQIIDSGDGSDASGGFYAGLVNGIIQHLAYHSGQISLLQKF